MQRSGWTLWMSKEKKKKTVFEGKRKICGIYLNSMKKQSLSSNSSHVRLPWGLFHLGPFQYSPSDYSVIFPPKCSATQADDEGSRSKQKDPMGPVFPDIHVPPWALGQTASSSFWLSFHYFIITFPSILPYSQPGKVSFLWVFSPMFPYLLIQSYCSLFSFFISSEVSRTVLLDTVRLPCAMIFVPTLMKGNSGSLIAEYAVKQKSPLKLI